MINDKKLMVAVESLRVMDIVLYRLGVRLGAENSSDDIVQRKLYEVFVGMDVGNQLSEINSVLMGLIKKRTDCDEFDRKVHEKALRLCEKFNI